MNATSKSVAIIMGSQSDWATMRRAAETLDELGGRLRGAHRLRPPHPRPAGRLRQGREGGGLQGDHRRGRRRRPSAGHDRRLHALPVFGVPIESRALAGQDSLLSIVQMPAGVPVGTLAIGAAGRGQRRAAGRRRAGARRPRPRRAARRLARRAHRGGRRIPQRRRRGMILAPGATIGILGAGQLGRMLAMAALKLGLRCHIFAPEREAPAYDAASARTIAGFDDEAALARFARGGRRRHLRIRERADRLRRVSRPPEAGAPGRAGAGDDARTGLTEKSFLNDLGLATAPFLPHRRRGALAPALAELGRPAVLKTRRFGYDGKGQALIREGSDLSAPASRTRRRPDDPGRLRRVRVRGFGDRRAQPRGRDRRFRSVRERTRPPHSRPHPCAGAGRRRRRGGGQGDRRQDAGGARLCRRAGDRAVRRPRRRRAPRR